MAEQILSFVDQVRQDLFYAVRGLWRSPGFAAGAIAVLALGIGANLALFQIFDATLIHRYSFPAASSMVRLSRMSRDGRLRIFPHAAIDFYRTNSHSFESLISEDTSVTVDVDGTPGRRSTFVSDNYFSAVGIHPSLGRVFDPQDVRADSAPVALLGHQYWMTQFASDPQVLGRVIHVNDVAAEIVGVLPPDFNGFSVRRADLWLPVNHLALFLPGNPAGQSEFFGKLRAGSTGSPGAAELAALTGELARLQPRYFGEDDRIQADLVQESILQFFLTRSPLIVVFIGMVMLILLSSCAHLGNMLLARSLSRQQEFAIRVAIGAGRARLTQQLVTENALLAVLGSAAGFALGVISARLALLSLDPASATDLPVHWQTVGTSIVLTFVSVFAFVLPTARETTRPGFQSSQLRTRFVANQVSVSCLLLIITGAFVTKAILNTSLDLKFEYGDLVVIDPQLYAREGTPDSLQRRLDALSARFSEMPGVDRLTIGTAVPLRGGVVDNFPKYPRVLRSSVDPLFFDVLGLKILRGRTFQAGEQDVAIASDSAARELWPNQDPLGKLWDIAGAKRRVVGVVADSGAEDRDQGTVEGYLPISSRDFEKCLLILHTRGDPSSVVASIPRLAKDMNETLSITTMRELHDAVFGGTAIQAVIGTSPVLVAMSVLATVLAAAGMFALVAFSVVQRTREIGIRIAIGATRVDILRGLLSLHLKPLAVGVVKGTVVTMILLLAIRALVFPERFAVFLGGVGLGLIFFLTVGVLATLIPALRALRIDPSKALRTE